MEQAFTELIKTHQALIYKVCHVYANGDEARRDLFQEIVAQLWRAFPKYNTDQKWTTWAYRIALNVAITQWRKPEKVSLSYSGSFQIRLEQSLPDTPYDPTPDERLAALHAAIAQLSPAEKALILLYLDGLSYADIAQVTGITENNAGVKLNRIKAKLKTMLQHGKS